MLSLLTELRHSFRRLLRAPVFTVVSVLTIGVGIGAFTSIFGLVETVLLERMPYERPEDVAWVWRNYSWQNFPRGWLGGPDIIGLREQDQVFEQVALVQSGRTSIAGTDQTNPLVVRGIFPSHEFFDLLGVPPVHGRGFLPEDDDPNAGQVVVLGFDFWKSHYDADPGVVGETVYLAGRAATVIGVASERFHFVMHRSLADPVGADIYVNNRVDLTQTSPQSGSFAGLARLRPGVLPEQLDAALAAAAQVSDDAFDNKGLRLWAVGLQEELTEGARPALMALAGSAAFLLLILSANLATLLLGRAGVRERELGIRAALGASKGRIFSNVLGESLIVGVVGGAIGVALAYAGINVIVSLAPENLPRLSEVGIDGSILLVAGLVTLGMAFTAGLAPGLHGMRGSLTSALKDGGSRSGGSTRGARTRSVLVAAQVALSLMLLVGAGLVAQAFAGLLRQDPGFDPGNTLTFRVALPSANYDRPGAKNFHERLAEQLKNLPGVRAAGAVNVVSLTGTTNQTGVRFPGAEGNTGDADQDRLLIDWFRVTPGYFRSAGLRVLVGRSFDASDSERRTSVIIDDVLARRFFPNSSPVGRQAAFLGDTATIVGVIDQPRFYNVHSDDRGQVYTSFASLPTQTMSYAVRSEIDPTTLIGAARQALRELDPAVPMSEIRTLESIVTDSLGKQRLSLTLLGGFALGALLLATLGIYGVVANSVTRRTQEMGVRMALGADAARVLRMVLGQGLRLVGVGAVIGLVGAVATSRLLTGVMVGVDAGNPVVYMLVAVGLAAVAAAASYFPARRATRIDPIEALRPE